MKILLAALNAKYIHSCPAVHYLAGYCRSFLTGAEDKKDPMLKTHRVRVRDFHGRFAAIDYTVKDPVTGRYRLLGIF